MVPSSETMVELQPLGEACRLQVGNQLIKKHLQSAQKK